MIDWFRDRPRFCWTLITWVIAGAVVIAYTEGVVPAWLSSSITAALYVTALRVDRRNRAVTRSAREMHRLIDDAYERAVARLIEGNGTGEIRDIR